MREKEWRVFQEQHANLKLNSFTPLEDLKLTSVRYYLDNDTTYAETCRIFNCSERSLKRWIDRFQYEDEIKRHNRCRCSSCEGECKTFRECDNPRPWKNNRIIRHGLIKCKTCLGLWNRDTNASRNMDK